jgi:hypothetical protein
MHGFEEQKMVGGRRPTKRRKKRCSWRRDMDGIRFRNDGGNEAITNFGNLPI